MIGITSTLKEYKDHRGTLIPINDIPFDVKRVFFIKDVPIGESRGNHFSKTSSCFYIAIEGECKVELYDGVNKEIHLIRAGDTLLFSKNVWMRLFDFSENTILCVLSDSEYCKDDYCSDIEMLGKCAEELNV